MGIPETGFLLGLVFMLLRPGSALGQTDTLFWFVAPDAAAGLGESPVTLHLSSGPAGAQVVVDQPANAVGFPSITLTLAPNSVLVYDLTTRLGQLENLPPNTIQPYGLRIRSNQPVGVLYEIKSLLNAASFTLKGKTALGTRFFIGGQATPFALGAWVNDTTVVPGIARSRFDLVASQDSTLVTITPRNALIGHAANVPFQQILMRGQTLACVASGGSGLQKVTGSRIVSDKPIAVTYSDDALYDPSYGTCRDMIGDQLVPVQSVGQDYIVGRGILTNGSASMPDRYYVTSTDTGTVLRINGLPIHSFTSAGETYLLNVNNPSEYIETTKPVYVFHVTGMGCEIGGALLPRINCTGSRQARFHRYAGDSLYLLAIVENGGQGLFTINGNPALLGASDFTPLPGNQWWVARKNIGPLLPSTGTISLINSQFNFHAGIIAGSPDGGGQPNSNAVRYAYFSDYGLSSNRDIYDTLCRGDAVFIGNRRYDTSGIYIIRYSSTRLCDSTVTLYLTVYPKDTFNLTPVPVQACGTYRLNGRNVNVSGVYTDSLFNRWGCDSLSRIQLTINPLYNQQIQRSVCDSFYFDGRWLRQSGTYRDTLISQQGCDSIVRLQLTIGSSYAASERIDHCGPYRWRGMLYNQSGTYTRVIPGPGGCDSLLELQLTVRPVPNATFNGPADHCLDNGPITLDQGQPPGGFYWGDAVRGNLFEPAIKRDYEIRYTVTNESGCSDTAVLRIRVHDECNAFLYLPDAFIPDDPTRPENRRFSMVSYNITKVEIKIFDRYGQVVFESRDPNFGWDGTKGGGQAPSGTYIYLLNYEDAAGKTGLRSGLLHLVR
jgi:gliding motility-associated-like protein